MNGAAGPDDDTRGGQLEAPQPMPSFFTRRGLPYPSFSSSRPPKELRGGHSSGVRALAWNADGSVLVSSGHDRMVRAWRPDESVRGSLTQTDVRSTVELAGHTDQVSALACHPTHPQLLATGSLDRTVRLWDLRAPTAVRAVNTPGANINIAYHPSGDVLAVGDKNETVSLVDASSGALLHAIKNGLVDREEVRDPFHKDQRAGMVARRRASAAADGQRQRVLLAATDRAGERWRHRDAFRSASRVAACPHKAGPSCGDFQHQVGSDKTVREPPDAASSRRPRPTVPWCCGMLSSGTPCMCTLTLKSRRAASISLRTASGSPSAARARTSSWYVPC